MPVLAPELTKREFNLRECRSQDEVAIAFSKAQDRLHILVDETDLTNGERSVDTQRRGFIERLQERPNELSNCGEILRRIENLGLARSLHVRIVIDPAHANRDILNWRDLLRLRISGEQPLLLLYPETESLIDVIVGDPSPESLRCLRGSIAVVPTTESPPKAVPSSATNAEFQKLLERFGNIRNASIH